MKLLNFKKSIDKDRLNKLMIGSYYQMHFTFNILLLLHVIDHRPISQLKVGRQYFKKKKK